MRLTRILPLVLAILVSCKKQDTSQPPVTQSGHSPGPCSPHVTQITDAKLILCKFKPGSYWSFTDSVSGKSDTLYVSSLNRVPYLFSSYSCDTFEYFSATLNFKHEPISAFRTFELQLYLDKAVFYNTHVWEPSAHANALVMYKSPATMHDSILLGNIQYKDVGESGVIEFVQDDPNRMESQNMKMFFNPDLGPLQFDFHDRLSGALTGRRRVTARVIVR